MGLFSPRRRSVTDDGPRGAAPSRATLTSPRERTRARRAVARACRVEALEERKLLAAQLLREINPTSYAQSTPGSNLVESGGKVFFWEGWELYATDGTTAGTRRLPGHVYHPWGFTSPIDADGILYFTGGSLAPGGGELWRSDGTAAGTRRVKDVNPGPSTSDARHLTNVAGTVYFAADDGSRGIELWKSDGTEAGTALVRDVRPGPSGSDPRALAAVGSTLFFVADDGVHGYELWKSDGTAAGTTLVRDILPGPGTSGPGSLTQLNGAVYFTADDGFGGHELWKSDGTEAGTYRLKDVQPGQAGSAPNQFTTVNGVLYFTADDGARGYELWKTDGTEAGTVLVRDIRLGSTGTGLTNLTESGGRLYFTANDGLNGLELWRSDGTAAGTVMVRDLRPGAFWLNSAPARLTDVNGTLYFTALTDQYGQEFWKTDGTAAGTVLVKDVMPGPGGSQPWFFTSAAGLGNSLLFTAYDGDTYKLFKSDNATGATQPILEVDRTPIPNGSNPSSFITLNGTTLFSADDGVRGAELWRTDGTAAGTALLKDLVPGPGGSGPSMMVNAGGTVFFVAAGGLWKTDGTAAGTQQLAPFVTYYPEPQLVAAGNRVFFRNHDATAGEELWVSNGTAAGTYRVKDIAPGAKVGRIFDVTAAGSLVYFIANDGLTGDELWRSDGTAAGTYLVRDLLPGPASSGPWDLEAVGSTLFFRATNGTSGWELFKTNGTAAGTVLVKDIMPGPGNSGLGNLRAVGNTLLFTADDGSGNELWRSDGTPEGTYQVVDIYPGRRTSGIHEVVALNGQIFFRADGGHQGYELWRSDGTFWGTHLVKDINPGAGPSTPINMVASGGTLFFQADDGAGYRVWQSDGSNSGTFPVPGVSPTAHPWNLVKSGNALIHSAHDAQRGYELWRSDFAPAPLSVQETGAVTGSVTPPSLTSDLGQLFQPKTPGAPPQPWAPPPPELTQGHPLFDPSRPTREDQLLHGITPGGPPAAGGPATSSHLTASAAPSVPSQATAAATAQAPTVFDGSLFYLRPELSQLGVRPLTIAYGGYHPPGDSSIMDEGWVRWWARTASDWGGPLVFDIEHWPVDVRHYSDGEVQHRIEHLTRILDWARDERPALQMGFYGIMPLTDYWTPISGSGVDAWQAANRRLQPLADKVDMVMPSLYAFYDDRGAWQYYADQNLRESAKYGKPIVPFLGMYFHESEPDMYGKQIAPDFYKLQLQTVSRYTNVSVAWGGFLQPWNDGDGWWSVTREFLAPKRLAAEIVNVTPHPRSAPVAEVTVRFTRPVTGFDLSDLSLSRQGGPNLLAGAPGVSLATTDGATWTLGGLSALTAADGTYTVSLVGYATVRDAAGAAPAVGASEVFKVDAAAPAIALGSFDYQTGRQIRYGFSKNVSATLDAGDLELVNRSTGAVVQTSSAVVGYDPVLQIATFTLPARLANGEYRAVLRAVGVLDAGGVGMAADYLFDFYMLTGDVNRDRAVNGTDFSVLAANFGKTGVSYAQGDLNGDRAVNGTDFALLSANFGRSVTAPLRLEPQPALVAEPGEQPQASPPAAPQPAAAEAPASQPPAPSATPEKPAAQSAPASPPRRRVPPARPVKLPVPVRRRVVKPPAGQPANKVGS